jgi:hypothetical protein
MLWRFFQGKRKKRTATSETGVVATPSKTAFTSLSEEENEVK